MLNDKWSVGNTALAVKDMWPIFLNLTVQLVMKSYRHVECVGWFKKVTVVGIRWGARNLADNVGKEISGSKTCHLYLKSHMC